MHCSLFKIRVGWRAVGTVSIHPIPMYPLAIMFTPIAICWVITSWMVPECVLVVKSVAPVVYFVSSWMNAVSTPLVSYSVFPLPTFVTAPPRVSLLWSGAGIWACGQLFHWLMCIPGIGWCMWCGASYGLMGAIRALFCKFAFVWYRIGCVGPSLWTPSWLCWLCLSSISICLSYMLSLLGFGAEV